MFRTFLISEAVRVKLAKLSTIEVEALELHLLAAFLNPSAYLRILEAFPHLSHGRIYDILTVETEVALVSLAFSRITGRMAILDFEVTQSLLEDTSEQPHAQ
jgi:hypothetical protein